jgi:hypothetical protein
MVVGAGLMSDPPPLLVTGDHLLAFRSSGLLPWGSWLGVVHVSSTGVCNESPSDNHATRGWHWEAMTRTSTMGMGRSATRSWVRTHHRGLAL